MERAELLQQKLENWCAISIRALADQPSAHFRGRQLIINEHAIELRAPYLQLDVATNNVKELRGVPDAIAHRLCFNNPKIHADLLPNSSLQRLIFELLEQLRTESLTPIKLRGVPTNLRNRFLFWARQVAASSLVENDIGLLIYTLTVMAWSRLHTAPIPEQIEEVIEATRWGLAEKVGSLLRALKQHRSDQRTFANYALKIAQIIEDMTGKLIAEDASGATQKLTSLINDKTLNLSWLESDHQTIQAQLGVAEPDAIDHLNTEVNYAIFTREFDRECNVTSLIRNNQLNKLRIKLDKLIQERSVNTHRIARYLKQRIAHPITSGWLFGEEQGYLDAARLATLVTSPNERKLFRRESNQNNSHCAVCILVDNSGSMSHHNETVAVLIDTLAKSLEQAGIGSEILGFTTGDWNGGRSLQQWQKAGKPESVGRLNSLQHTIYKDSETPWRRARRAIAGLLRTDLFRESIDGEALQWASARLALRPEKRKILLVISDGSPLDTATIKHNGKHYLDFHLAHVTRTLEQRQDIQLCAIGVGLDMSTYYQRNLPIALNNELVTKDYLAIADLLATAK